MPCCMAASPALLPLQALSEVVLRLAARGSSAASLLPLLQLASSVGEAAAQAQLQGAVLDVLLPPRGTSSGANGGVILESLAAVLPQCSRRQVEQLRQAVQATLAAGSRGASVSAAVGSAVRLCYQSLHAAGAGEAQAAPPGMAAGEADGGRPDGSPGEHSAPEGAATAYASVPCVGSSLAASLFVLGPFSAADSETRVAEAGLLISSVHRLAAAANMHRGSAGPGGDSTATVCWLLAALEHGLQQLHLEAATAPAPAASQGAEGHGQGTHPSQQPMVGAASPPAAAALVQAAPEAVQALLLSSAGGCDSVRQAALGVVMALPASAQAPLRLLQSLTQACNISGASAGAASRSAKPAELPLAPGLGSPSQPADGSGSISPAAAADSSTGGPGGTHRVQLHALLAVLELLGEMAAGYEQQRAAFQQRLAAEAEQQQQQQQQPGAGHGGQQQQQQQLGKSKAGRPLRPASEWWVGDGQQGSPRAGGNGAAPDLTDNSEAASAAAGGARAEGGAPSFDYMRGEDQAGKHEAAAQLYLDSLLAAADTPPACFLPLLERLAGEEAAPPAVQVREECRSRSSAGLCVKCGLLKGPGLAESAHPSKLACLVLARLSCHHYKVVLPRFYSCLLLSVCCTPNLQAAALRALGRLAVLSEPLCCSAVQLAERCLCSSPSTRSGTAGIGSHSCGASDSRAQVQQAAVSLLANAIDAHPNRFGGKLLLIGQLMVPDSTLAGGAATGSLPGAAAAAAAPVPCSKPAQPTEQLARVAAGAYCRLLLRNKLKLQDHGMLRPVGCALAGGSACVAAIVRHALCQLLQAAPPKDRARLCLDLFHQTPLERGWRQLLAEVRVRVAAAVGMRALLWW